MTTKNVARTSDKLLINSSPIVFQGELAEALGNDAYQAMLLQQVQYWLHLAETGDGVIGKFEDGRWWIYQEMRAWRKRFRFMCRNTIYNKRRALEAKGVLLRKDEAGAEFPGGCRVWYSIDYDVLDALVDACVAAEEDDDEDSENVCQALAAPTKDSLPSLARVPATAWKAFTKSTSIETSNQRNQSDFAAPSAAKSGSPAAQPPTLSSIQPRKRSEEKRVKSEEDAHKRIPADDLTPLGKFVLSMCGKGTNIPVKPHLTQAQVDKLAEEHEVGYAGQIYLLTPDDLFENDPLYKTWIETEVYPLLRTFGGDKPLARDKFIAAISMGNTLISLSHFVGFRQETEGKKQLEIAFNDPSKAIYTGINMLEEFDDDEEDDDIE